VAINSLALNPKYIAPSAWWQHVPLAYWLISELKPGKVVELGTHYGVSLFAFCEAAEALSPDSFVFAIDTWEGDKHAGSYTQDVFLRVSEHWERYHRRRARLVRSTFDEAATYFESCSIDMLHIDGLHTYEAVRNDFYTWLPLLKDDCIVLFHDINVREREFGVWMFWQELKQLPDYTTLETLNGHGLGILIRGQKYQYIQEEMTSMLGILTSKGELLEKLAELTPGGNFGKSSLEIQAEQARAETQQARAETQQARAETQQARAEAEHARAETEKARAETQQAREQTEEASSTLRNIENSRIWKLSKPVRVAIDTSKRCIRF
jgi:hypothetical protein